MRGLRIKYHRALNNALNAAVLRRYGMPEDHPMLSGTPDYARAKVLSRAFYIPGRGLFYQRLPKCANSTISKTLAAHAGLRDQDDQGLLAKTVFHRIPTEAQFRGARKVVFLRDPVSRALSGWRDKGFNRPFLERHRPAGDAETVPTFLQFLQALEANRFYDNPHFIPQSDMIPGDIADYTVGTIEDLDRAMAPVCEEVFGTYRGLSQRTSGRTNAAARAAEVTSEERAIIERLYGADIALHAGQRG